MELRVLGCSGGVASGSTTSAFLLDEHILLDAGTGAGRLSHEDMLALSDVFLTHSHIDHVACLPLILDTVFDQLEGSLNVTALPETLDALRQHIFNWAVWPDFTQRVGRQQPVVMLHPMNAGESRQLASGSITMLPANHSVPAAGYLLTSDTETLAFSGDCTSNTDLWAALNAAPRLDHLIVDVAFPNEREAVAPAAGHFTPRLLANDLAQLSHDPVVWVTHTMPSFRQHIFEQCRHAMPDRDLRLLEMDQMIELT